MKKYILANWKMNMNKEAVIKWVTDWQMLDTKQLTSELIVAPSYIHMNLLEDAQNIYLSGQDVSASERGAKTGDVAAFQLKDYCKYCIVGHSERKESKEEVLKKAHRCLEEDIIPIICFTNPDKASDYFIEGALMTWEDPDNISVNGVFKPKDKNDIIEGIKHIRSLVPTDTTLLYGGSVNESNISDLNAIDDIDGVLVGSASLNAQSFYNIAKAR